MDPDQTFVDMFEAMKNKDLDTARERALALKEWLAKGGFYPHRNTPQATHSYIDSVLRRTTESAPQPAFSLVCQSCDAGEGLESEEQAMSEGWSEIDPAVDFPMANYCGLCPDCRRREEHPQDGSQ